MRGRLQDGSLGADTQGNGRHSQNVSNDPFLKALQQVNESQPLKNGDKDQPTNVSHRTAPYFIQMFFLYSHMIGCLEIINLNIFLTIGIRRQTWDKNQVTSAERGVER